MVSNSSMAVDNKQAKTVLIPVRLTSNLEDLEFLVGYLAEFVLLGVFINPESWNLPYGSMRRGLLKLIGSLTPDALLPWEKLIKPHYSGSPASNTDAELIGASDMTDLVFDAKINLEYSDANSCSAR